MHPILHLAPSRHPEYRRGLAHGLALAIEQLHALARGQAFLTPSSVLALVRRLSAISDNIRREAWNEADQLFRHETAPPSQQTSIPTKPLPRTGTS